jgi:hypothetical protein
MWHEFTHPSSPSLTHPYPYAPHTITRLVVQDLTPQAFACKFEQPRLPVVITGITDAWPAQHEWMPEQLLQQCGKHKFKVWLGVAFRTYLTRQHCVMMIRGVGAMITFVADYVMALALIETI